MSIKAKLLFIAIFGFLLSTTLAITNQQEITNINPFAIIVLRWLTFGVLGVFGVYARSLTVWIFIAMLAGGALGYDAPNVAVELKVLSEIFLRLIKTIIAPLIFATLVVGIAGHANLKQVGRMGIKAFVYFEVVTTAALFIGLAAINLTKAGVGVQMPTHEQQEALSATHQSWNQIVLHIFPENIAKSVVEGQILQIVVFSIVFGIALAMLHDEKRKSMLDFAESLTDVMFKFTNIVMMFAPFGVGGAMASTVGRMGLGVLINLFKLLATLYLALAVFLACVLLPIALIARIPVRRFIKSISEAVSIAFATASSEAALPRAMTALEDFGIPRRVVAFVLPTGYSFNLDGTTLYLSLASIFVAQAAGIHMPWSQQLLMVFTLMLTSKGVAGVARASMVILLGTAATFHLPIEPIFLIVGIDALMDMARTAVNVIGNCLAAAVVARWEGEYNPTQTDAVSVAEKSISLPQTNP